MAVDKRRRARILITLLFVLLVSGITTFKLFKNYLFVTHHSTKLYHNWKRVKQWDRQNGKHVNIFLVKFDHLSDFYGRAFDMAEERGMSDCSFKDFNCEFQHTDHRKANVLFFSVWSQDIINLLELYRDPSKEQLLAAINTEAETRLPKERFRLLEDADIRMDYHPSSDVLISDMCTFLQPNRKEIKPENRKGILLLLSDCAFEWRIQYIKELMEHVHIDSYGRCLKNSFRENDSREHVSRYANGVELGRQYRMFLQLENTITPDYITEKLTMAYESGAIPVYWGPAETYNWLPGNHTIIDPQKYRGPLDLARYLKRVDAQDEYFIYHTSNFDWEKTREHQRKFCPVNLSSEYFPKQYLCALCKVAHEKMRTKL